MELFRYWWWPGLAFAATYYLSWAGLLIFVLQTDVSGGPVRGAIAGGVAGMMAVYCHYLGRRRHVENQLHQIVPPSLLRCPFVMGILSKQPTLRSGGPSPEAAARMVSPTIVAGKHS
jgi:hypothetical protein